MFELSKFELSGKKYKTLLNQVQGTWEFVRNNEKFELSGKKYKTLLNQVQGTWEFVRNNEKFELSGIRINGCVLYLAKTKLLVAPSQSISKLGTCFSF